MENKVDWKVGDSVAYAHGFGDTDTGVVTRIDGAGTVWAKWDRDGHESWFHPGDPSATKTNQEPLDESAETKAVTLLLSLGYTLKKGV